jgi:hypothetical protein
LTVLATDPASPSLLDRWHHFSLRIGYSSDRPVRISAQPFFGGRPVPAMSSGTPISSAGTGEAFYWIAFTDGRRVDEVRIKAESRGGAFAAQISLPVDLAWTGQTSAAPQARAEWVQRMEAERERRSQDEYRDSMNGPIAWLEGAVGLGVMMFVPAYFVLQVAALWRLRGGFQKAAAIPLVPMGAVLAYTVLALRDGSNLFPLVLIFASPLTSLYLAGVLLAERASRKTALGQHL